MLNTNFKKIDIIKEISKKTGFEIEQISLASGTIAIPKSYDFEHALPQKPLFLYFY